MQKYREPCTGACCARKMNCIHYHRHLEYKREGKHIINYIGEGNPSRCYLNSFVNFKQVELAK